MNSTNSTEGPNPTTANAVQTLVPTHGAEKISDSTYWTIHGVSLALAVISVIVIFAIKGPRRKDATIAMMAAQRTTST